jgi:hypothetical protein
MQIVTLRWDIVELENAIVTTIGEELTAVISKHRLQNIQLFIPTTIHSHLNTNILPIWLRKESIVDVTLQIQLQERDGTLHFTTTIVLLVSLLSIHTAIVLQCNYHVN